MRKMVNRDYHFDDFTESSYKTIIKKATQKYSFIGFDEYRTNKLKVALWRHDIDYSVHRALALARLEHDENIKSTFFVYPHSEFYSIFESEIVLLIKGIAALGHDIGLHFDTAYYYRVGKSEDEIETFVEYEKLLIYEITGYIPNSISIHNPDASGAMFNNSEMICGMVNAYSDYIKCNYKYCSDSNGYWRFDRLPEVIDSNDYDRIHILTHPEWWTPDVLSPRQRIQRCIDGRAKATGDSYDIQLDRMGRENVK